VNGMDQLQPTPTPSDTPTIQPTVQPTTNPSVSPSVDPTTDPTLEPTADPSISPTAFPSVEPTWNPTVIPTQSPQPTPMNTAPETRSIVADLDNFSMLYIIFALFFVIYLFVCFYIWCNERRKRVYLQEKFRNETEEARNARLMFMQQHGLEEYADANDAEFQEYVRYNIELNKFDKAHNVVYLADDEGAHRAALMDGEFMD